MAPFPRHSLAALVALLVASAPLHALDDQWYVGLGGGAAFLRPDAVDGALDADGDPVASGTLFVGRDLDDRSSVQLQLHGLGETGFDDGRNVAYTAGDASILYRFFDSRDRAPRGTVFGVSIYGRFGLGLMQRDTAVDLEFDANVNFGAGAGVELYLTPNIALRAEGVFHDRDAGSANLSFVTRFGGSGRRPPRPSVSAPTRPETPPTTTTAVPDAPDPMPTPIPVPVPPVAPDVTARAPGLPATPPDAPMPGSAPLPETISLPRGSDVPLAPGSVALPGTGTLPETATLPGTPTTPVEPPSVEAGVGTPRREAPIELPTLPAGTLPVPAPTNLPVPEPVPEPAPAPAPAPTAGDADGDGVADADDTCPRSTAGFPVRDNGCAMLDGLLSGLKFDPGTAEMAAGTVEQLDYLAGLLAEYPAARIELLAHTDDTGSEREQSILTRARLKSIGTYLVQERGIRANRVALRSFGGTLPLYDNRTSSGREGNNRIEIVENTS